LDEQVLHQSPTFGIVRRSAPAAGATRLAVAGHLDVDSGPLLIECVRGLLKQGARSVELDLCDVPFISSMGVGSLIALIGEARELGGDVALCAVSPDVLGVLKMLDLLDYVTLR
jgi:anti-sigma B factor antagonist